MNPAVTAPDISPRCFLTLLRVARRQADNEGRIVSIDEVFDALLGDGFIVWHRDAFMLATEVSGGAA